EEEGVSTLMRRAELSGHRPIHLASLPSLLVNFGAMLSGAVWGMQCCCVSSAFCFLPPCVSWCAEASAPVIACSLSGVARSCPGCAVWSVLCPVPTLCAAPSVAVPSATEHATGWAALGGRHAQRHLRPGGRYVPVAVFKCFRQLG
ncbi:unnamed protein product, partial [Prorocentrum cordatum]